MTDFDLSILALFSNRLRWEMMQLLILSPEGLTPILLSAKLKVQYDTVTHHLVKLRDANLVIYTPSGQHNLYYPNRDLLKEFGRSLFLSFTQGESYEPK